MVAGKLEVLVRFVHSLNPIALMLAFWERDLDGSFDLAPSVGRLQACRRVRSPRLIPLGDIAKCFAANA